VLISAFITPHGPSGQLLDAAERGVFVLCLSCEILTETAGKLVGKTKLQARYGYTRDKVELFCDGLAASAELATDLPDLTGAVPNDPKDDVIVASAVAAQADYLVAGDRAHLLKLGSYRTVRIVGVREFLTILAQQPD
jgi:putative PIN family toxin of toxin-antitoxin system